MFFVSFYFIDKVDWVNAVKKKNENLAVKVPTARNYESGA
jgi:hypothetical protein